MISNNAFNLAFLLSFSFLVLSLFFKDIYISLYTLGLILLIILKVLYDQSQDSTHREAVAGTLHQPVIGPDKIHKIKRRYSK